jgi:hypothetical protein
MKKTPNIIFPDYSLEGIHDVLSNSENKKVLFESIFNKIKNSYKTSKKEIIVCDIIQLEVSISISKVNWVKALQAALDYNVSIEDYSTCTQINKLIKDIQNG